MARTKTEATVTKKKPGRPKGSKNKKAATIASADVTAEKRRTATKPAPKKSARKQRTTLATLLTAYFTAPEEGRMGFLTRHFDRAHLVQLSKHFKEKNIAAPDLFAALKTAPKVIGGPQNGETRKYKVQRQGKGKNARLFLCLPMGYFKGVKHGDEIAVKFGDGTMLAIDPAELTRLSSPEDEEIEEASETSALAKSFDADYAASSEEELAGAEEIEEEIVEEEIVEEEIAEASSDEDDEPVTILPKNNANKVLATLRDKNAARV